MTNLKMNKLMSITMTLIVIGFSSCSDPYDGYYDPPADIAGHLYEQLAENSEYSTFIEAVDRIPELPNIINKSGLYTVFAPNNDAWKKYFASTQYSSVQDIPLEGLTELVENHILLSMWFEYNFDELVRDDEYAYADKINFQVRSRAELIETSSSAGSLEDDLGSAIEGDNVQIYYGYRKMGVYTPKHIVKGTYVQDYKTIFGVEPSQAAINFGSTSVIENSSAEANNGVIHGISEVQTPKDYISVFMKKKPEVSLFYDIMDDFMDLDYKEELSDTYKDEASEVYTVQFSYPTGTNYTGSSNVWGAPRGTWSGNFKYSTESADISLFAPTNENLKAFLESKYLTEFTSSTDIPVLGRYFLLSSSTQRSYALWPSDIDYRYSMDNDSLFTQSVLEGNESIDILSNGIVYTGDLQKSKKLTSVIARCLLDTLYDWTGQALVRVSPNEEPSTISNTAAGKKLVDLLSEPSLASDQMFTFLTPNNNSWAKYGFTFNDFQIIPDWEFMNSLGSPKLWMILKTHALLGLLDKDELESGSLADGYYPTASRLYVQYDNGAFAAFNRDTSKVETYMPSIVNIIPQTGQLENNGLSIGVDGILDLNINKTYPMSEITSSGTTGGTTFNRFIAKCNEVKLFHDGEIDWEDQYKVQNMTLFCPTAEAIASYDTVVAMKYIFLPAEVKAENDSTEWTNAVWRNTLKGLFSWDPLDPFKRICLDADNKTGDGNYETENVTYYLNKHIYVTYEGGKIMLSHEGGSESVEVGVPYHGQTSLEEWYIGDVNDHLNNDYMIYGAYNQQCVNGIIHIIDKILPLPEYE